MSRTPRTWFVRVAMIAVVVGVVGVAAGCSNPLPSSITMVPGTLVVHFPNYPPPPYNPLDPTGGNLVCVDTTTSVLITGVVNANGVGLTFNGAEVPVNLVTEGYRSDPWGPGCARFRYDATRDQSLYGSDVTVTFTNA